MIYDYIIMDNVTSSLQLLCTALAQQSFNQTITNNTNSETTPAGTKHFQVMCMRVCTYVYVRPFADSPDQQTSNQHLSNLNNHLKQSTQASINASQEYLTVRPHPQGPSISSRRAGFLRSRSSGSTSGSRSSGRRPP